MLEAVIVLAIVGLDQLAKYLTDLYLSPLGTSFSLWQGVFHLTSAHNTGAAFSMLAGNRYFLIGVSALASCAIVYILIRYRKRMHTLLRVCFAVILAGALGNLIDRVALGYVRDMLDFTLIHFAIFNVADSAVTVGAVLMAFDLLFGRGKTLLQEADGKKPQNPDAGPEKGGDEQDPGSGE